MKTLIFTSLLLVLIGEAKSQNLVTTQSKVSFFSDALLEDISAETQEAKGILNLNTGEFFFKIPIQSFVFENGLMQEHFNENYMESEKYPFATFKGKLDLSDHFQGVESESLKINAPGKLNIHGVEVERSIPVEISGNNESIAVSSVFTVALADHKIEIPTIVFQKIAEQVEVKVNATLSPMVTAKSSR